jgi:hypothetical protein
MCAGCVKQLVKCIIMSPRSGVNGGGQHAAHDLLTADN